MFTGLVERLGTVTSVQENDQSESGGNGWTLTLGDAAPILSDCHIGDSIAVNGKSPAINGGARLTLFSVFPWLWLLFISIFFFFLAGLLSLTRHMFDSNRV